MIITNVVLFVGLAGVCFGVGKMIEKIELEIANSEPDYTIRDSTLEEIEDYQAELLMGIADKLKVL